MTNVLHDLGTGAGTAIGAAVATLLFGFGWRVLRRLGQILVALRSIALMRDELESHGRRLGVIERLLSIPNPAPVVNVYPQAPATGDPTP